MNEWMDGMTADQSQAPRRGGSRSRGIRRPDPTKSEPGLDLWAGLALRVYDELYEPLDVAVRPGLNQLATNASTRSSHLSAFFNGRTRIGSEIFCRVVGLLKGDLDVWRSRWEETENRYQQGRRLGTWQPLPGMGDEDTGPVRVEAVGDWSLRRVPVKAATAKVAAALRSARRRRRARRSWQQRQIILGRVHAEAADLLASYRDGPLIPPRFVRLGRADVLVDAERRYPEDVTIGDLLEESAQNLVLVSEAGIGKTTQLALLAQELAERALAATPQEQVLLPLLLNLSTYRGQPLEDWVVAETSSRHDIPAAIVRGLLSGIDGDSVLLLLDGLDEIRDKEHRRACARQLREYRRRCAGLVVTCRSRDKHLADKTGAVRQVLIEEPSASAVQAYVTSSDEALTDVRAVLESDPSLMDLLRSPLMLKIISRAYAGRPADGLRRPGTAEERQERIFDAYLARMLTHRRSRYRHATTLTWLGSLARALTDRGDTLVYLDRIDQTWTKPLGETETHPPSPLFASILTAVALALAALGVGWALSLLAHPYQALLLLTTLPVFVCLKTAAGVDMYGLKPVERLRWSWSAETLTRLEESLHPDRFRQVFKLSSLGDGLLPSGVVFALLPGRFTFSTVIAFSPMVLIGIMIYVHSDYNLVPSLREQRNEPNEGIRRSVLSALIAGSTLALALALLFVPWIHLMSVRWGTAFLMGTVLATTYGLARAFQLGGSACVSYWLVRLRLRRHDLPLRLKCFLHDAEQRILLRRVGSGFAFPHQLLQKHLATRSTDQLRDLACRPAASAGRHPRKQGTSDGPTQP